MKLAKSSTPPASQHITCREHTLPSLLQKRLQELGFRQRLGRPLKWPAVFCLTFSVMSPMSAITGLYFQGLMYGGPVALIWGWVLTSLFTFVVGLAFSELCSAMPQSGGELIGAPAGYAAPCISTEAPDGKPSCAALQVCISGEVEGSPAVSPCMVAAQAGPRLLQELHAGGETWRILVLGYRLGGLPQQHCLHVC